MVSRSMLRPPRAVLRYWLAPIQTSAHPIPLTAPALQTPGRTGLGIASDMCPSNDCMNRFVQAKSRESLRVKSIDMPHRSAKRHWVKHTHDYDDCFRWIVPI